MTITTPRPRRRISSRTKKRCRNIKNFFCKALNTKSDTNNKNQSSPQISISDLKEKISSLETQLNKISKHCYSSTQINDCSDHRNKQTLPESKTSDRASHRHSNTNETKVLYRATSSHYEKTDASETSRRKMKNNDIMIHDTSETKYEEKKSKRPKVREMWQQEDEFDHCKKLTARHLAYNQNTIKERKKKRAIKEYQRAIKTEKQYKQPHKNETRYLDPSSSNSKKIRRRTVVDEDFISSIIKKQYKPTKMFDVQHSNMSQLSAPVCRDKEYSMRDKICYDYDLCSCCFDQPKRHDYKKINSNVSDMRSVCDARLYSSKKRSRYHGHSKGLNDFNNADLYDLIPVKEKSSPKARKKIEYASIASNKYNEVRPSPRTLRPRLNLQAKMYDESDGISHSTSFHNKNQSQDEINGTSDNRTEKNNNLRRGMSTLLFRNIESHDENVNESKQSTDTDRNLAEIKDLLQSFITVINENSAHGGNNTKLSSNNNNLHGLSDTSNYQANATTNLNNTNIGNTYPHYNVPPVMPIFPNNCCYPVMPIYPVNYLQNGYLFPNVSNTCNSSAKASKQPKRSSSTCDHKHESNSSSETHELLKEIHNFVTQNPITVNKKEDLKSKHRQYFVTRSVGDSSIASNYNKKYMNTKRCVSKSCEAIGRGDSCNIYSNTSFSDTALERFSVEATRSTTDFNPTFEIREIKTNKLKDIFTPWKWGKKKNDVLDEISEGEDIIEEDIEERPPPFRQNITNYAMYSQEYYHPPPIKRQPYKTMKHSTPMASPRFTPRNTARNHSPYYPDHPNIPPYYHDNPQTPPYQRYHPEGPMPQVPLCLKEIEVKSAGTQSERKMSLFKKLLVPKKVKVASEPSEKSKPPAKTKSGIFNWKTLKESAKTGAIPKDFTFKTQQQLAQGDTKMKNALIKKLFYKRNPFSPRNLIVKTLLGNDPSSYGNPPKLIKPKYFI
ncbi:uncharacterized protein DDB_G0283697-like [Aricia agestis]|uniref:uncharacterized protein DDB_G0283697-like n=1 Tax=Aricia agestis TaxID=91739 RepID=UPI001C202866|nr:uncharacterized protein DDB_G0283697-like [Aricia agestis]